MKIVHLATVAPHQNGLYETTHDLVVAELRIGIDSRIVEPYRPIVDRGVWIGYGDRPIAECDILVNHSGLGVYADTEKPIVHVFHGRPESSFRLEQSGRSPVLSMVAKMRDDSRFKAFVTFWELHKPFWELMVGPGVEVAPAPVDLEAWCPGESDYDFNGRGGTVNVICTDLWRVDKTPFHLLTVFAVFAASFCPPGAKLHLYGLPEDRTGIDPVLDRLRERGVLGETLPMMDNLLEIYRAADLLISPHRIATRAIREAMACGCPVLCCENGNMVPTSEDYEGMGVGICDTVQQDQAHVRHKARVQAEWCFSPTKTAEKFKSIYETVLKQ